MLVPLEQATAGMQLDQPVYDAQGNLLLPAATILTARQLELLSRWKVASVPVADPPAAASSDGAPATPAPPSVPELVRTAAEQEIAQRFRHIDPADPVMAAMRQLAYDRALHLALAKRRPSVSA